MKRKIISMLLVTCCLISTGCAYYPNAYKSLSSVLNSPAPAISTIDNTIALEKGSALKTDQFRLKINSAQITDYWEGYYPEDSAWRYLVVNVTIKNTYNDEAMLDLYGSELGVRWDDLGNHNITPEAGFSDAQLPNYEDFIKVFKKTSRTGNLIYVVPEGIDEFQLSYDNYLLSFDAEEVAYDDYYGYDGYGSYSSEPIESYGTMETAYFDLTINSLSVLSNYEEDGTNGQYVAVNVTIENTNNSYVSLDFYDYEFTLSWKDFYDHGQYPETTADSEPLTENQFPDTYTIFSGDSKTGDLVYLVPQNATAFAIEYYDSYGTYRTFIINSETDGL